MQQDYEEWHEPQDMNVPTCLFCKEANGELKPKPKIDDDDYCPDNPGYRGCLTPKWKHGEHVLQFTMPDKRDVRFFSHPNPRFIAYGYNLLLTILRPGNPKNKFNEIDPLSLQAQEWVKQRIYHKLQESSYAL